MTPRDVPHSVWAAIESIPKQRGPYDACRCQACADERAADAVKAERADEGLWR